MRGNFIATDCGETFIEFFVAQLHDNLFKRQSRRAGARQLALHRLTAVGDINFKILLPEPRARLGLRAVTDQKTQLRIDPIARRPALLGAKNLHPLRVL